jgi:two-component system sensor histidine kinase RpfC
MIMLSTLRSRIQGRTGGEFNQAKVRLILVSVICIVLYIADAWLVFNLVGTYLLVAIVIFTWILFSPAENHFRKIFGVIGDTTVPTMGMILLGDESSALFVAVYLWVITGNGFRFGIKYLALAAVLSFAGFRTFLLPVGFDPASNFEICSRWPLTHTDFKCLNSSFGMPSGRSMML